MTVLLGVVLLVAGAAGVVLLEVLIKRADVAAVMVSPRPGPGVFVDEVPALQLSGGRRVRHRSGRRVDHGRGVARVLRLKHFDRFQRWLLLLAVLLGVSLLQGAAAIRVAHRGQRLPSVPVVRRGRPVLLDFRPIPGAVDPGRSHLADHDGAHDAAGLLRWIQSFAGLQLGVPASKWGADAAIRVLDGPYVFFLAQAFVLTIPAWLQWAQSRRQRVLSVVLLLMVIALNRRTAWLAVVAGIAVLLLRDRRLGRRATGPGRGGRRAGGRGLRRPGRAPGGRRNRWPRRTPATSPGASRAGGTCSAPG